MSTYKKGPNFFWRCEYFEALLHRSLEQDVFIFNPLTGHTHILNQLGWQILVACAESPRTEAYLFKLMAADSDDLDQQQLEESLLGHLGQLQQLDLLQARPCN